MQKIFALLLAFFALFTLTACGSGIDQTTDPSAEHKQSSICSHSWKEATCTSPKTCSKCGTTEGDAIGHSWKEATCTAPKTCTKCETTEGDATGHSWDEATCTAPKTCSKCGAMDGSALGHNFMNNVCTICNEPDPVYANALEVAERIKIYGTYIDVNSADGVSVYITWENNSSKEIKYMRFRVELYNRVNDRLKCDISGDYEKWLNQTGPIPQGKGLYDVTSYSKTGNAKRKFLPDISYDEYTRDESNGWADQYWKNMWYNSAAHYVKITGIEIEYMDGTTYSMLDKNAFDQLDIINVTQSESVYDYDYKYPVSSQLLAKDFPYENEDVRIDKLLIDKKEGTGEDEAIFVCRLQGYNYSKYGVNASLDVFDEKGNQVDHIFDVYISEKGDFVSWEFYVSIPRTGTYYIAVDYAYG